MDKTYRGYFIGSHKLRGLWFAYGWAPEPGTVGQSSTQGSRIVFVDEADSREEAERRVREEMERILKVRF